MVNIFFLGILFRHNGIGRNSFWCIPQKRIINVQNIVPFGTFSNQRKNIEKMSILEVKRIRRNIYFLLFGRGRRIVDDGSGDFPVAVESEPPDLPSASSGRQTLGAILGHLGMKKSVCVVLLQIKLRREKYLKMLESVLMYIFIAHPIFKVVTVAPYIPQRGRGGVSEFVSQRAVEF